MINFIGSIFTRKTTKDDTYLVVCTVKYNIMHQDPGPVDVESNTNNKNEFQFTDSFFGIKSFSDQDDVVVKTIQPGDVTEGRTEI